ncbi:MAG: hypothetical protein ACLPY5_03810 [Candidatus Bathyarchaeia archaeon]
MGYAIVHGGDPYGVLPPVRGLSFANVFTGTNGPTIAYLPFWPLVTGLIYLAYSLVGVNDRFIYYFLLKQPIIFGDVSLAYLLYSYVSSRKPGSAGFWVLSFWLFSPFTIIISGIWGMFDSIAICFLIISVSSIDQVRRAFWTGLAIFVKSVPIIFAAPITMKKLKSIKDVSGFVAAIGLPVVLSGATLIIMGWSLSTVSTTLVSTAGKGGWSMSIWTALAYFNYLGMLPPVPQNVYGTLGLVWIPAMVIFTCIAIRHFRTETDAGLFQALLVCTLVFLLFKAQVTEQYGLYLFALGAVDVVLWNPQRKRLLTATMIVAMIYLVVNNYFLVRFLSPVYPNFVEFESTMNNLIGSVRNTIIFLTGTAFTVLNVAYLADVLTRKKNDR